MEFLSNSTEETAKIAANFAKATLAKSDFARKIKPKEVGATVIGLYGELGSGKTTFMKSFVKSLGVEETIQSPTFVIMKKYELKNFSLSSFQTLIHIDAYRLDSGEDLLKLGWEKVVSDPKNLICIEWPEKVAEILSPHIVLKFEHAGEQTRKISIA
jgi:tRNA threonylcarbamoyladenosine biosynthesis protein TsaE